MNIGNVIKKYRKESGFTQEEMANRLGVTTPAVNKWEILPVLFLLHDEPLLFLSGKSIAVNDAVFDRHLRL